MLFICHLKKYSATEGKQDTQLRSTNTSTPGTTTKKKITRRGKVKGNRAHLPQPPKRWQGAKSRETGLVTRDGVGRRGRSLRPASRTFLTPKMAGCLFSTCDQGMTRRNVVHKTRILAVLCFLFNLHLPRVRVKRLYVGVVTEKISEKVNVNEIERRGMTETKEESSRRKWVREKCYATSEDWEEETLSSFLLFVLTNACQKCIQPPPGGCLINV